MTDTRGRVRIYEVGPRDGLQNEATPIPTEAKARFVALLVAAGLREIEATSFVSPSAIPQLADADALMALLDRPDGVRFPVLVPNQRGLDRAEAAGVDAIAVFTAASDAFTARNIGMTVEESLTTFAPVLGRARDLGWWTRGYVSTAFGCPYTGHVEPSRAVEVAVRLVELGVDEVCFGDTIGVGVPGQVEELTGLTAQAGIPLDRVAYHFHDTRGTALANVVAGLRSGIRCFDSAAGGTGGCPYAPGAAGNLATEDLVYLLDAEGWETGVSLAGVLEAARFVAGELGKPLATKVGQAGGWDPATGSCRRTRLTVGRPSPSQHERDVLLHSGPMDGVVLVLNQNYEPLNVCNLPRAFRLLFGEKAEVIEFDHQMVRTPRVEYRAPSVIRLQHMVRRPRPRVKLSRREVFSRDRHTCQYCGRQTHDLTLDHVMPRHRGGGHTWENLVTACKTCNHRKGGKTLEEARLRLHRPPYEPRNDIYSLFTPYLSDERNEAWRTYLFLGRN